MSRNNAQVYLLLGAVMSSPPAFSFSTTSLPRGTDAQVTQAVSDANEGETNKRTEAALNGAPAVGVDGEGNLTPSIDVGFSDTWLVWTETTQDDGTVVESGFWKYNLNALASLNGKLQGDDNEQLIQNYLQQGGNIDFGLTAGVSAFGGDHEGMRVYLVGDYSEIDTQEFTSPTEVTDLKTEVAKIGLGVAFKWGQRFHLAWEGQRAHILGEYRDDSVFMSAIDQKWIQGVNIVMRLEQTLADDENPTYLRLYRTWGGDVPADIRFEISKNFTTGL